MPPRNLAALRGARLASLFWTWSASFELGYGPAGDYATTVREEIEWLSSVAIRPDEVRLPDYLDVEFFKRSFDYPAEDNFLRERSGL